MSVYDHMEDIEPKVFLGTFAEALDCGVIPEKIIRSYRTDDYTNKPYVKYDYRKISIKINVEDKEYEIYAIYDNSYAMDKHIIGTKNTEMTLITLEDRKAFEEFMDKYCRAGYDFDDSLTVIYQECIRNK